MGKDILRQIEKGISGLTPSELLKVIELIIEKLKGYQISSVEELDLRELYGIGKNLWSEDAQEYVDTLRREERI